jgi:hypothetical protein
VSKCYQGLFAFAFAFPFAFVIIGPNHSLSLFRLMESWSIPTKTKTKTREENLVSKRDLHWNKTPKIAFYFQSCENYWKKKKSSSLCTEMERSSKSIRSIQVVVMTVHFVSPNSSHYMHQIKIE